MNQHKRALNKGLSEFQSQKRNQTLIKIDAALQSLHTKHLPITKASIADEIGCSRQALQKDYITKYLREHPLYNANISQKENFENSQDSIFLQIELEKEQQKRRVADAKIKKLLKQNTELQDALRDMTRKYQKLLGRYQADMGRKFIHL
ncbi:hypothetical protein H6B10_07750 [Gemmiger formicilis]|uniref:hypothetical protein n=1 Tax=Gemmiger formicilis TaxID=745368 RepID=UPI001959CBAC|nr:hypothetical protein [Gemmiger formicilis]MBM6899604.1 hypothetical protein [Gemmiger formicilis]